jgi:hypothetical protein
MSSSWKILQEIHSPRLHVLGCLIIHIATVYFESIFWIDLSSSDGLRCLTVANEWFSYCRKFIFEHIVAISNFKSVIQLVSNIGFCKYCATHFFMVDCFIFQKVCTSKEVINCGDDSKNWIDHKDWRVCL